MSTGAEVERGVLAPSARWFRPLMVAAGFAMAMTAPVELLYAAGFGIGSTGIAVFILSTSLAMMAVDVLGTRVVPHLDARTTLTVGIGAFGISCAVLGLSPTFASLVVGRIVQGLGAGLLLGAGLQAAIRVSASRERALGSFNSAFLFGAAVGAPAGGLIAGLAPEMRGFRLAFVVCAGVCLLVAVAMHVGLPRLVPPIPARARIGLPRFAGPRGLRLALLLGTVGDFVRGGVVYTALPLAGAARAFSPAMIGIAVGLLSAIEILVLSWSDRILLRVGVVRCLVVALVLGVASSGVLAVGLGWLPYLVGSVLFGVVVAGATIGPPLLIVSLTDEPAAGLATFRISSGIGMLVGSTGAAVAAGTMGTSTVFVLVGAFLAGGIVLALAVGRRLAPAS